MGLSNSPKDTITTLQVLSDILLAVKDVKNIETLAKQAYALPEAEQKKADASREQIAQAKAEIDAANKAQIAVSKESQALEIRKQDFDKTVKSVEARTTALNALEDDLEKGFADLKEKQKAYQVDKTKLDADRQFLDDKAKSLDEREAKLKELESEQKEKAKQLKALMEG
jgi:predicted  nucleic acid-binding Zn-ribbon protein